MRHDDAVYLRHMLETIQRARQKAEVGREAFDRDDTLQLALVHLVQVLGEVARRVSPEMQSRHPEIPWAQIIGMRHRLVHDYLAVDLDIVWAVVKGDLPELERMLDRAVRELGSADET